MRRRSFRWVLLAILVLAAIACIFTFTGLKYAYEPGRENDLSRTRTSPEVYDYGAGPSLKNKRISLSTPDGKISSRRRMVR